MNARFPRVGGRRASQSTTGSPPVQTPPPFPASRPRRLRRDAFTRALVREHRLGAQDLILPVFVHEGSEPHPIDSMPGV